MTENLTARIVDTALGVQLADVPESGHEMVKYAILDLLACAVAGSEDDCATIATDFVASMAGAPQSTVLGTSVRAPAMLAAYANATAAHALDYDDVSLRMVHPSATMVPALLAVGERDHTSGIDLLTAYVAGFEVQARICASINPEHYARGWHTTGTVGVLGTALAVARMRGLSVEQATYAFGISAASAKGIRKNFGSMVKPLHAGQAALHGIEAVELAARGFTGDVDIMSDKNGYIDLFTTAEGAAKLAAAFAPGVPLELVESGIGIKRFACCGALHPSLDAMERLLADHDIDPRDVVRIEGRMNKLAPGILVHHDAKSGLEGKFSLEYSLAVYLLHGRAGLAQYTDAVAQDPELIRLMHLVDFVVDEELPVNLAYFASVVTIELTDGRKFTQRIDVQRGYPELPLSLDELTEKVVDCCATRIDRPRIDQLIELVANLEKCPDVAEIGALLAVAGILMSYSDRPLSEMVVPKLLVTQAERSPDAPFLRFGDDVVTFGEMHANAQRYAAALESAGVGRGDLVAIMMANSIDYVSLYFGLAYRGAAVVLVNTSFRGYMLEYVLNDAGCSLLLADGDLLPVVAESEARLGSLERVLVRGEFDAAGFSRIVTSSLDEAVAAAGATSPDPEVSYTDLHCVVYSSGTTGPSKGIMISHGHAVAKAFEVLEICQFTKDDVLYSPLPLFYSMGLLRGVLSVTLVGASIVLRDKFSVSAFWDEVRKNGATVGHCVFAIPRMLQNHPADPRDREHKLRCMFNARHDPEFEERFGVRLIESYGLTEAGNSMFSRLAEPSVPGSCGRASDEWDVRLATPDGEEVPIGEPGEILIRPREPQRIMIGYLNKPDATRTATRDLWLHTGDIAARDEAGYYFYKGRLKDMIRRRGQNISAWEVEQIILEHPAVGDVAAIPYPSDVGEDDLRVVISPAEDAIVVLAEIQAHCLARMPAFMVPRYFESREQLPRTPSGRVEKYRLIEEPLSAGTIDRG